jgi:hypothetical protein
MVGNTLPTWGDAGLVHWTRKECAQGSKCGNAAPARRSPCRWSKDFEYFQQFGIYELKGERLKIEFSQPGWLGRKE